MLLTQTSINIYKYIYIAIIFNVYILKLEISLQVLYCFFGDL